MNEILNPPWPVVRGQIVDKIESLRARLENAETDWPTTQVLRGEIRALKRLLGLPEELAARQQPTAPPGWPGGDAA